MLVPGLEVAVVCILLTQWRQLLKFWDLAFGFIFSPAESAEKKADIEEAGRAVVKMLEMGLKPSDILTREAFEDAITVTMALGGSTNSTLHLLAIAHAANVELTLDDFNTFQEKVPHLADLKPSGQYVFQDLYKVGGYQQL